MPPGLSSPEQDHHGRRADHQRDQRRHSHTPSPGAIEPSRRTRHRATIGVRTWPGERRAAPVDPRGECRRCVAIKGVRSRSVDLVIATSCLFVAAGALVLAPGFRVLVASVHAAQSYHAGGVIQSIARDRSSLMIAHEAIPGFMPAMTMSFEVRSPEQLAGLHEKEHVSFSFTVTDDGRRLIDRSVRRRSRPENYRTSLWPRGVTPEFPERCAAGPRRRGATRQDDRPGRANAFGSILQESPSTRMDGTTWSTRRRAGRRDA